MSERDLEAPDEDFVEQLTPAIEDEDEEAQPSTEGDEPLEADAADRADQERSVGVEDDEYR